MSACSDKAMLLHALVDGELDAANCTAIESHVKGCAGCTAGLEGIVAVRNLLFKNPPRLSAPPALRQRVEEMIDEAMIADTAPSRKAAASQSPRGNRFAGGWFAGGAISAMAASLALFFALPQLTATGLEDQLVASHVRSLLATHLTDVATSDQHVVKPWFNGKINFSPPVVDLVTQGFPLVGGRLDYVDGAVVPALVYHRRLHSINLFIRPVGRFRSSPTFTENHNSYSIAHWTDAGLEYWAVSDIPAVELEQFRDIFQQQSK